MRANDQMKVKSFEDCDILPEPNIVNIVATLSIGIEIVLQNVCSRVRNAEYEPKTFSAVIMKMLEPKTTALLFASGKMIITGARSKEDSHMAARKFTRLIQKVGYPEAKFLDFTVQNMVASLDVMFPIDLESFCVAHCNFVTYEPEIFPGLVYRLVNPAVVLLIFISGKVLVTGAKSLRDVTGAIEQMYSTIEKFRIQKRRQPQDLEGEKKEEDDDDLEEDDEEEWL